MTRYDFIEWCKHTHDVSCNQKYDSNILYSKHLQYVAAYAHRFKHLVGNGWVEGSPYSMFDCVEMACYGHDLIEDARVTYNDIKDKVGKFVADLIYCCTEEKGRDRTERHAEKYYQELTVNKTAIFVKLCDIMANLTYSILTNSDMIKNQVAEYPKIKGFLWYKEFEEMFVFLEALLALGSGKVITG